MKKSDLVSKLLEKVPGISNDDANKAVNAVFEIIAEGLENGDSYSQDKFGTFKVVERAPRKGRNPQTGEVVDIPAKLAVKFVVSGSLKDKVNE